ncbi:MAG: Extensin family protein [Caulobacter sp.]|nr:Extensin family protein [Caulobacter sp.]
MPLRLPTLPPISPSQRALAAMSATVLELILAALLAFAWINRTAAPQDLPWKPFSMSHPVGLATRWKLARIGADPARCRQALDDAGLAFVEAPDQAQGFCSTANSLRLGDPTLRPRGPVMRCDLALTYEVWRHHVVEPAARRTLGAELTRIEHVGTYACRTMYSQQGARPSNHATASALDVVGFRLQGGGHVSVRRDYRDPGPKGQFLREVKTGGCRLFGTTLTPDYNAAHADHYHLDMGRYRLCR